MNCMVPWELTVQKGFLETVAAELGESGERLQPKWTVGRDSISPAAVKAIAIPNEVPPQVRSGLAVGRS